MGGLRITYCANQLGFSRLGFAVSRKYGNAVQRNRLKRQLRNYFRRCECHDLSIDMLIIPAVNAKQMHNPIHGLTQALAMIQRKISH